MICAVYKSKDCFFNISDISVHMFPESTFKVLMHFNDVFLSVKGHVLGH